MGSLGIAIDGGRYVRVDSSTGDFPRTVKLRTLSSSQKKAKLDFCVFRKNGPIVRKTFLVEGLSGAGDNPAELKLSVQRTAYALWLIDARKPDGSRERIRVRTGIGLWPFIALAALLLISGVWLLITLMGGSGLNFANKPPVEKLLESEESEVSQADEGGAAVISVLPVIPAFPAVTTVYFQPESSVLSGTAEAELENLVELIPEGITLEVGGHCANYGTEKGRRALSLDRARAVALFLSERIPPSVQIQISSYGSSRPLSDNPESQDKNRRVEITSDGGAE